MSAKTLRLLAAVIVTLPLASCGKKTNPALFGTWEGRINNATSFLTFEKDGNLGLGGEITGLGTVFTSLTLLTDFGLRPGKSTPITYKCISPTQLEVEGDFSALLDKLSAGGGGPVSPDAAEKLHPRETLTYRVEGKELTLTNAKGFSTIFHRVD